MQTLEELQGSLTLANIFTLFGSVTGNVMKRYLQKCLYHYKMSFPSIHFTIEKK